MLLEDAAPGVLAASIEEAGSAGPAGVPVGAAVGVPDVVGESVAVGVADVAELLGVLDGVVGVGCGGGWTVSVPDMVGCPTSVSPIGPSASGTVIGWAGG